MEIEAKMKLADPAEIEQTLRTLNAVYVGQIFENNTYLDTADAALRQTDTGLRIRIENQQGEKPKIKVTYKGPRHPGQLKSRSEIELRVSDAEKAFEIFKSLGYQPVLNFEKCRRRWEFDCCRVELDTLPLIGHYIEIEGPDDQAILAVREKLHMENVDLITESYIAILKKHLNDNQLDTTYVTFENHP